MILDTHQRSDLYRGVHPGVGAALAWVRSLGMDGLAALGDGRHELPGGEAFATVNRYTVRGPEAVVWEAHRRYIDVQVMVRGRERVGWVPLSAGPAVKSAYEAERDAAFYDLPDDGSGFVFEAGQLAVFFPEDVHAPGLRAPGPAGGDGQVLKVVVKVPV